MSQRHAESKTGFAATFRPLLDDRGARARRITRGDLIRAAQSENTAIQGIAKRLKHAIKSEGRRITLDRVVLTIAAILVVFVMSGVISGIMLPVLRLSGSGAELLVFIGLVVLAHLTVRKYVRRGTLNQLARTAVAEGVCGSCAFPLQSVPVSEEDACMTCPECGAAWLADRIVEPFWERRAVDRLRGGFWLALMPGVLPKHSLFAPDDRGRFVQTPDSRLRRVPKVVRSAIPCVELKAIRRSTRRVGAIGRYVLTFVLLVLFPGSGIWGVWSATRNEDIQLMWFLIVVIAIVATPILLLPFGAAFSTPHRTSRAIVRHGRCGCCLSPLDTARRDANARSICAECGSAWLDPKPGHSSDELPPKASNQPA